MKQLLHTLGWSAALSYGLALSAHAQSRLNFDYSVWAENFRDDFNGPTLNRAEWDTSPDHNQDINNHFGWGSEWYDFQDTSLVTMQQLPDGSGVVCLTAKRWLDAQGQPLEQAYGTYPDSSQRYVRYRSGMLVSKLKHADSPNWNNHSQQSSYGAWEARLKLPANPNAWPAFWLWCSEVEIDIVDGVDINNASPDSGLLDNVIDNQSSVAGIKPPPAQPSCEQRTKVWNYASDQATPALLSDSFHVYTLTWTPEEVTFFFDGREIRTVPRSVVVTRKGYPLTLLTLQMYSWVGSGPHPDPTETAQMYIDWVRILKPKPDARGQRNYHVAPSTYKTAAN